MLKTFEQIGNYSIPPSIHQGDRSDGFFNNYPFSDEEQADRASQVKLVGVQNYPNNQTAVKPQSRTLETGGHRNSMPIQEDSPYQEQQLVDDTFNAENIQHLDEEVKRGR